MSQLALEVEPPLVFVARRWDGTVVDVVPHEGDPGAPWWPAVAWCLIALDADNRRRMP